MSAALKTIQSVSGEGAQDVARELAWTPGATVSRANDERTLVPIGYLFSVSVEGATRRLRAPLKLEFSRDGKRVLASAPYASVWGSGSSVEEAIADLEEMLVSLYREYSNTPREQMHSGVIVQGRKIQRLFEP